MMDIKQKPVEEKTHNRRGSAFHTLAHVMRDLRELVFTTGFIMRNRPGRPVSDAEYLQTGKLPFQSMVEMLFPSRANNGNLNGITIGRQGDGEFRNTNVIQIEADHDTAIGESRGYVNGVIRGRVSRNGSDDTDRSGLYIMDRGTESASREGTIAWLVASGEGGQVRLSYMADKGGNPLNDALFDIYISSSGISIFGLPTSAPSTANKLWRDSGVIKIT